MARAAAAVVLAVALLCASSALAEDTPPRNTKGVPKNVTVSDAEKPTTLLSGNSTGVGGSCTPTSTDFFGPGSGCADTEACCPTTNTCFDRKAGCAAFARRCPPPDCGRDLTFSAAECPADVTKLFKKGGVSCQASSDTFCFTNATALALKCAAGASAAPAPPAPRPLAALAAGAAAVAGAQLLMLAL